MFQTLNFVTNKKADHIIRCGWFETAKYGGGQNEFDRIGRIVWITQFSLCNQICWSPTLLCSLKPSTPVWVFRTNIAKTMLCSSHFFTLPSSPHRKRSTSFIFSKKTEKGSKTTKTITFVKSLSSQLWTTDLGFSSTKHFLYRPVMTYLLLGIILLFKCVSFGPTQLKNNSKYPIVF